MCGIHFTLQVQPTKAQIGGDELDAFSLELLQNRGPDHYRRHWEEGEGFRMTFTSTVLHMRGSRGVEQPLISNNFIFQWNGEVFDGLEIPSEENDTMFLFARLHQDIPIRVLLGQVRGPWAFLLYDKRIKKVYYGRDPFGRRSLLCRIPSSSSDHTSLVLSSVAPRQEERWEEVPVGGIYEIDLARSVQDQRIVSQCLGYWSLTGMEGIPRINRDICTSGGITDDAILQFLTLLRESIKRRVLAIPAAHQDQNVSILFSGGVDSILLAALSAQILPTNHTIDLINVAFENERFNQSLVSADPIHNPCYFQHVPDRISGMTGWKELERLFPERNFNFISVNVTQKDYQAQRAHVINLMNPLETIMDLSIAIALWFAARGKGILEGCNLPYLSKSRIILVGMGADEQLGGYSRHLIAFKQGGLMALVEEMQRQLDRIGHRNLGRDDRCIADHGREARFPYLDEQLVSFLCSLPVSSKCDLSLPRGQGEKRLLRLAIRSMGFSDTVAFLPKRAIQFGAKTAKINGSDERGCDLVVAVADA